MMGNRGELSAPEWDAFSRKSRKLLHWRPGEIRKLKRSFAKRIRKEGRKAVDEPDLAPIDN